MYPLANFTSVLEVATALCFGYGLLKSVYEFPLVAIERQIDNSKAIFYEFGKDHPDSGLNSIIGLVERSYSVKKPELEKTYIRLARTSIFLSVLPISLLIFAGFYSENLSTLAISGLLFLAMAIVPALAFIAWLKSKSLKKEMDKHLKILNKEAMEVLFVSQSKASQRKKT